MNKKILLSLLFTLIGSQGLVYAEVPTSSIYSTANSPVQIAAGNGIVRDAVMQGIYTFGTTMLNRYTNPTNVYYAPYSTPGYTTQTVPQTTTVPTTTTASPNTPDTVPDQPEPMVIVQ
jgi:hypothetical protein